MAAAICELTWLRYLFKDLRIHLTTPSTLYCDNLAAMHIVVNPVFHEQTKHIKLVCHLICDKISKGQVITTHVPSSAQLMDLLTKPLHSSHFNSLLSKMGVVNIYSPSCRGILKK